MTKRPNKTKHQLAMDEEANMQAEMKDPMLLYNLIKEIQKEGIEGEENTILCLIIKIMLRLVTNHHPTSSNVVVSDKTGGGKDFVAGNVCKVILPPEVLFHRTALSEKVLNYWKPSNKKDGDKDWSGKVIYLEDPSDKLLECDAFKIRTSGRNKITVLKDQNVITIFVKGKPVFIVTSYKAEINEEGDRRWDALRIDTSQKITERAVSRALKLAAGKDVEKHEMSNELLRHGIKELRPFEVVIPFAEILDTELPTKNVAMRTQVFKLIDYMKGSAILHQWDRERDEQGRLVATLFDYDVARYMFSHLKDADAVVLSKPEEQLIDILKESGTPISLKDASQRMNGRGRTWVYEHLSEKFQEKGLVQELTENDVEANKDITKYYYVGNGDSEFMLPAPEWMVVRCVRSGVNDHQRKEKVVVRTIREICINLDKDRQKIGLRPVFNAFLIFSEQPPQKRPSNRSNVVVQSEFSRPNDLPVDGCPEQLNDQNLHEKVNNLRDFIKENKESGRKIDTEMLVHKFNKEFIDKCKEQNVLVKNGDSYIC